MWWPNGTTYPTEEEMQYAHCDNKDGGLMMWNVFNCVKNSSTRCEIAPAFLAMLPEWAANMGIDTSATVEKGQKVITHQREKGRAHLRNKDGGRIPGGKISSLHRGSPFKKRWHVMKDGDLWKRL